MTCREAELRKTGDGNCTKTTINCHSTNEKRAIEMPYYSGKISKIANVSGSRYDLLQKQQSSHLVSIQATQELFVQSRLAAQTNARQRCPTDNPSINTNQRAEKDMNTIHLNLVHYFALFSFLQVHKSQIQHNLLVKSDKSVFDLASVIL